jgi:hypothetical protein
MWFKDFDGLLIGGQSMAQGEDSFTWINLAFQIHYELVYPNKFLWKDLSRCLYRVHLSWKVKGFSTTHMLCWKILLIKIGEYSE